MACGSCADRRKQIAAATQNLIRGQSIRPQVQQFNQSVRTDLAQLRMAAQARISRAAALIKR